MKTFKSFINENADESGLMNYDPDYKGTPAYLKKKGFKQQGTGRSKVWYNSKTGLYVATYSDGGFHVLTDLEVVNPTMFAEGHKNIIYSGKGKQISQYLPIRDQRKPTVFNYNGVGEINDHRMDRGLKGGVESIPTAYTKKFHPKILDVIVEYEDAEDGFRFGTTKKVNDKGLQDVKNKFNSIGVQLIGSRTAKLSSGTGNIYYYGVSTE